MVARRAYDRIPAAAVFARSRYHELGVFAYNHGTLEGNVLNGFEVIRRPSSTGTSASARARVTVDLALADLHDPAHAKKHLFCGRALLRRPTGRAP